MSLNKSSDKCNILWKISCNIICPKLYIYIFNKGKSSNAITGITFYNGETFTKFHETERMQFPTHLN